MMVGRRPIVLPAVRHRRTLARMAVAAVDAGWPVVPGAWWSSTDHRFVCDVLQCTRSGPHPAMLDEDSLVSGPGSLVVDALTDRAAVIDRWRRHPYAVLVPTGVACDAVEVPVDLGRWIVRALQERGRLGPVLETGRRWTIFTSCDAGPTARISSDVLQHGLGSWVSLPPGRTPAGEALGWVRSPQACGWMLADHEDVRDLLHQAYPHRRLRRSIHTRSQGVVAPGRAFEDLVAMMS